MTTHILRGSKQEIVDTLAGLDGEVREAIVFVEDSSESIATRRAALAGDIFEEMRPFMVEGDTGDDSRVAIYTRTEGE
jgi:hypothetical protein